MSITKICKVADCKNAGRLHKNGNTYLIKGMCNRHYISLYRHGDAQASDINIKKWNADCRVDNCISRSKALEYCHIHYQRLRYSGRTYLHNKKRRSDGMSGHPLESIWSGMLQRCDNISSPAYRYYGGRGISVCDRWKNSLKNFVDDMGSRPTKEHSIDRIDGNGDYEPSNCRWADKSVQSQNRGMDSRNRSGYTGVQHHVGGKWRVKIGVNGQKIHIGLYDDISDAVEARKQAELKYWQK